MTDINTKRISEILRLVFDLLWFEPQGLYASEIMQYIQTSVPLSDFETGHYPFAPTFPRYEVIIRVGTIPLVRAGWLEKAKNGRWLITEAGRTACKRFNNPEDFFRESISMFLDWNAKENNRLAQLSTNPSSIAVENSWEQIRQYIESMSLQDLRLIVASLLKALGCFVTWTASGGENEDGEPVDLICYTDPLGLNSPRILVHIANKTQVSTIEGLSGFMTMLKPGDVCLYIAFGGATNQLKEFALSQTDNQVRLIDLEKFVELWIENQAKIDAESRARFPLKPIYFLAFPEGN